MNAPYDILDKRGACRQIAEGPSASWRPCGGFSSKPPEYKPNDLCLVYNGIGAADPQNESEALICRDFGPLTMTWLRKNGLLVSAGSAGELKEAVEVLAADSAARVAMGTAGWQILQRQFSRDRMISEIEALYDACMAGDG